MPFCSSHRHYSNNDKKMMTRIYVFIPTLLVVCLSYNCCFPCIRFIRSDRGRRTCTSENDYGSKGVVKTRTSNRLENIAKDVVITQIDSKFLSMKQTLLRTVNKSGFWTQSNLWKRIYLFVLLCTFLNPFVAFASIVLPSDQATNATPTASPLQNLLAWFALFSLSAVMHSAESAITKISPWKVQQFAEEEGSKSPFSTLSKDITRLLITILLTTTACSIYSTALFVATISQIFPKLSLGFITAALVRPDPFLFPSFL